MKPRDYHVGDSDYSGREIQPWDIWIEYDLNPFDADIVKRVLRDKGERRMDYEKIIHVCKERIRQIDQVADGKKTQSSQKIHGGSLNVRKAKAKK